MKKDRFGLLIVLMFLALSIFLLGCASKSGTVEKKAQEKNEKLLVININESPGASDAPNPYLFGDKLVFEEALNEVGSFGIYLFDISDEKQINILSRRWLRKPEIYDNSVYWIEKRFSTADIFSYNLAEKNEKRLIKNKSPTLYSYYVLKDYILFINFNTPVWGNRYEWYKYDKKTQEVERLFNIDANFDLNYNFSPFNMKTFPEKNVIYWWKIRTCPPDYKLRLSSGSYIVTDATACRQMPDTNKELEVFFYDLEKRSSIVRVIDISDIIYEDYKIAGLSIFNDQMVLSDNRNGSSDFDIFLYDLNTGKLENLTSTPDAEEKSPVIYGNFIAYTRRIFDNVRTKEIVLFDNKTKKEKIISKGNWSIFGYSVSPSLQISRYAIVWADNISVESPKKQIYVYKFQD